MSKAKENSQVASKLLAEVGSVLTADSDSLELLSPGTNGQVLTVDSTTQNGIKWSTPDTSGLSTAQITDLTDTGDTTLHYHAIDRDLTVATGVLDVSRGGTNSTTAQVAINTITNVAAATAGDVLTKVGSNAAWTSAVGVGDVSGPASSIDSNIASFNGTTGKLIKDSGKATPAGALVGTTDIQTLTNKTLTSPVVNTPTGITKSDVGLGNVDNTSDATKWGAVATVTNKTMSTGSTWNGNAVPAINGGTAQTTYVAGDTLYASAANTLAKLPIGSTGQVLTVSAGAPAWVSVSGTGDVVGPASAVDSRVASFNGTTGKLIKDGGILTTSITTKTGTETLTNKTISTGSVWQGTSVGALYGGTAQSSYMKGDILYSSATNTLAKLPVGSTGQVLAVSSAGTPSWVTNVSGTTELGGYDPVTNYTWWVIGYKNAGAYMGYNGVTAAPDGQGQWLRLIPTVAEAPIEFNIYNSGSQGIASSAGTGTLTRLDAGNSTPFTAAWIGKRIQYGSGVYTVSTVSSTDSMTVTPNPPVSSSETFHVAYHRAFGFCNTTWDGSKTIITRVSGDPFIPTFDSTFRCWINGVLRTVVFVNTQTYYCYTNLGTLTGVAFEAQITINDQLTTLRVQKMTGSNEENLSIFARYDGYHIRSYLAGLGKERPIYIGHTNTAAKFDTDGSIQIGNASTDDTSNWFNSSWPGYWSTTGTHLKIGATSNSVNPPVWVQNTTSWNSSVYDHYASCALFETIKTGGAGVPNSLTGSVRITGGTGDAIGVHGQVVADIATTGISTGVWARATGPNAAITAGAICGLEINVDNRYGAIAAKGRKDGGSYVGLLIYNFSGAGKANHFGFVVEGTATDAYHVGGLIEDFQGTGLNILGTRSANYGLHINSESADQLGRGIYLGTRCATAGIGMGDNKLNWGNSSQSVSNEGDMLYNATSNILYFNQGGVTKEIVACSGVGTSGSYIAERKAAVNINGVTYYILLSTTA